MNPPTAPRLGASEWLPGERWGRLDLDAAMRLCGLRARRSRIQVRGVSQLSREVLLPSTGRR